MSNYYRAKRSWKDLPFQHILQRLKVKSLFECYHIISNNFIETLKYKRHSSPSLYSCLFIWGYLDYLKLCTRHSTFFMNISKFSLKRGVKNSLCAYRLLIRSSPDAFGPRCGSIINIQIQHVVKISECINVDNK